MIDTTTRKPLRVSNEGDGGPYIMAPVIQLDTVTTVLDANRISYWVDEEAMSLDGKPEIVVINLENGCDPIAIQRLLDSIP